MVRTALADYRCDILESMIEKGQRAFAKMRFSGSHVGQFRGYAPTGKPVQWVAATLFHVNETCIVDLWMLCDLISLDALLKENAQV